MHRERDRLHRHWEQRLERATYEAERAERQYQAVEPENRLVARGLERRWEEALRRQRDLEEEYDRFLKEQPPRLSEDERAGSWRCPATSRRCGTPRRRRPPTARRSSACWWTVSWSTSAPDSERAEVTISWKGGLTTRHEIVRSVSRYESLSDYDRLMDRIIELRREGLTIKEMAVQLNAKGSTPRDPARATRPRRCESCCLVVS